MSISSTVSESEETTFSTFLRAVFWGWAGLMTSGIIGVGFAVWALVGKLPAFIFGLVGIVAIFVACYMVWRDERLKRFEIEKKLAEKQEDISKNTLTISKLTQELLEEKSKNIPKLVPSLSWFATSPNSTNNEKETVILFELGVSNLGMPSIATKWQLVITVDGKDSEPYKPKHFPKTLTLDRGFEEIVLSNEDAIYNKTSNPIATGSQVIGLLYFSVPYSKGQIDKEETILTVNFQDVIGENYSIPCKRLSASEQDRKFGYTPNMQTQVKPPKRQKLRRSKKPK